MGKHTVTIWNSLSLAAATQFLVMASLMTGPAMVHGAETPVAATQAPAYAGSKSCRECHERFYGLWSTSFYGLALQSYTETLAKEKLSPQKVDVVFGKNRYLAEIGSSGGLVL